MKKVRAYFVTPVSKNCAERFEEKIIRFYEKLMLYTKKYEKV